MTKEEFIAGIKSAFSAQVQPATVQQIAHIAETPGASAIVFIENSEQFEKLKVASSSILNRWPGGELTGNGTPSWCLLIENSAERHGHRLWRHNTSLEWLRDGWTSHYDGFYILSESSFVFGVDELI